MNPLSNLATRIDKFLQQRGFEYGLVRTMARNSILLSGIMLLLGLFLLPFVSWPFWLSFGTAISTYNFFSMAGYMVKNFPLISEQSKTSSRLIGGQLGRWFLRLSITAFLVYMALVHFGANPFALLIGLALTLLCIPVLLFSAFNN